jgi:hypothetical protein
LNSEIVGKPTDGTWGFRFPRYDDNMVPAPLRHPSQLYELTLGLSVLGALYLIDRSLGREKRPRGAMIASFFALYFSGRFVIEFFKEFEGMFVSQDSPLRMGQILSLPGMLLGYYGVYWSFKNRLPAEWPHDEDDSDVEDDDDEDDVDDDEGEDDSVEDEDDDDDEEDEARDDRRKSPGKRDSDESDKESVDPDVAGEFDAEGRLKRQREP